ncbi:MAG: exodeoxyribonuclease VII large subunit, partial [Anaerolineae bacterium]|nr:exodeoxyribonuclease VII large subunit [Anaerolineae bacterium]
LAQTTHALERNSPQARLANNRQRVDDLTRRLDARIHQLIALRREKLNGARRHLAALNPEATLARGYAIVRDKHTGHVIKSVSQVQPRTEIRVRVRDGEFDATANT